jgi:hypothetical protein
VTLYEELYSRSFSTLTFRDFQQKFIELLHISISTSKLSFRDTKLVSLIPRDSRKILFRENSTHRRGSEKGVQFESDITGWWHGRYQLYIWYFLIACTFTDYSYACRLTSGTLGFLQLFITCTCWHVICLNLSQQSNRWLMRYRKTLRYRTESFLNNWYSGGRFAFYQAITKLN